MTRISFRLVTILAVVLVVACGDDRVITEGIDATMEKVAGDSQGVALSATSDPLVVRVLDGDGEPYPGIGVIFMVTTGTGDLTDSIETTDMDGLVSTRFIATNVAGARRITAAIAVVDGPVVRFDLNVAAGSASVVALSGGDRQSANTSAALPLQLSAKVTDGFGNAVAGSFVQWRVVAGGGTVSADSSISDASGIASVTRTLGAGAGGSEVRATVTGLTDTVRFHATGKKAMTVLGGGSNVPERYTSDLWIHGNYGYTGTWGFRSAQGNALKIWNVTSGAPALADSIIIAGVGTLSDDEVSADGAYLLVTAEGGGGTNGLYIYSLADPAHPTLVGFEAVGAGLHTGTFADIGGQRYVFASKDPGGGPSLMGFRVQPDSADKIVTLFSLPQGGLAMHDQFYRDGLLFASVWNNGLKIYDVGDGRAGGTPGAPQLVGSIVTPSQGLSCNCVHNAWWYHDTAGGKRYVFVGQEGPGSVGTSSSGDIHVVDVTDLAAPEEVAFFHLNGGDDQPTGVHNFWMDESRGILYAAYYNGGVVALDVTGTLSGSLASREVARLQPGGGGSGTYIWGVMLVNGALWASDMVSGFWKLSPP